VFKIDRGALFMIGQEGRGVKCLRENSENKKGGKEDFKLGKAGKKRMGFKGKWLHLWGTIYGGQKSGSRKEIW